MFRPCKALTIAGSDSGGCAGIQADLKTFAALGVHGMTAITSVTAQDTLHVYLATDLPLETIGAQVDAVMEDIGAHAVKTGMLSSAEIIVTVAKKMKQYSVGRLVVDPVMVSTGGDLLMRLDAIEALKRELLPLALVVTPNMREAEFLTGMSIASETDIKKAAAEILSMGPRSVILKGGHFEDPLSSTDYFFDGQNYRRLQGKRFQTRNTHGSGCTFASALTAFLARGMDLTGAVECAKCYVTEAIRHSFAIGKGSGPLAHFYEFWTEES
ncbi:MAG: bifunctional hydroxymethylpyrimidine kinase/phosphomethylpyrimidine kinase [Acidobacteria bacterium]|nr:bifunctional hydroxymethylpyrimidine kinase/phosphomethylpyrimidine kinase [Acidobacteriota bacterium]